jgi:hypothetical protein
MKRWAALTVFLYALALAALVVPVMLVAFSWGKHGTYPPRDVLEAASAWGTWLWVGIAALGQALLLVVPVGLAEGRPIGRRKLAVPFVTAAALLALMTLSLVTTILCGIFGDDGLGVLGLEGVFPSDWIPWLFFVVYPLVAWSAWGYVFYRRFRDPDPQASMNRLTSWLLRGSILELLVAVPSHVIVRNRSECCAPFATFWGLATGLTVMLMSFGPGVFFLFAERMKRLRRELK